MDEPSQSAREALRRYHAAAGLTAPARERVWRAIEGSLDAAPPTASPRSRARPLVFGLALAAAAVIAVCGVRERLDGSTRMTVDAAGYQVEPDERRAPSLRSIPDAPRPLPGVDATRPRPRASEATPGPDLAAEMALLRRARSALDAGDPSASLRALDEHARSFAAGQMAPDRLRLRVEALCAQGERAQARAEAASFLAAHPDSPHRSRVEKICRDP